MVASPAYIEQRGIPKRVADLASHNLIGFTDSKVLNKWPLPDGQIQPNITASNGETVRQLALSGNGIACMSGFMVNQDIEQGRLITVLEESKLTQTGRERVNAVYYKSSSLSKRITAFIDFIQPRLTL